MKRKPSEVWKLEVEFYYAQQQQNISVMSVSKCVNCDNLTSPCFFFLRTNIFDIRTSMDIADEVCCGNFKRTEKIAAKAKSK